MAALVTGVGGGFVQSAGIGAVSGVATAGIGHVFGGLGGASTNSGVQILNEAGRALAHGAVQGGLSELQGGSFKNGFASGALGSIAGSGFQAVGGNFANSIGGGLAFSSLSGGVGAELTGGDFWRGAGTGATVALLNHYGKDLQQRLERPGRVNLKKNPVRGLRRWMRYINRYKGIDPTTGRAFNMSDMINSQTVPKKHWFMRMFGMMDDASGISKVNGKYVKWYVEDASISSSNLNNIDYINVPFDNGINNTWKIEAYRNPGIGRFNLTFYNYEIYSSFHDYIFGN